MHRSGPVRLNAQCWRGEFARVAYRLCVAVLVVLIPAHAGAQDARIREVVNNVCAGCHGADGNSVVPIFPKLAGRHAEYIAMELRDFRSGKRPSDMMAPVVASLDPADFIRLGEYFGAQVPTRGQAADPQVAEVGRRLYAEGNEASGVPACEGCHDTNGTGGKRFPRLAGQHREYLLDQMEKFRKDIRKSPASSLMRAVAKRMTDEEIRAVTEYLVGL